MPPAIAAIGAAWTAIGSLGIVGGMIQGALVGAAIGGISSAVMGGDFGKGLLYGAVGGAVMGGISSALNGASLLSSGTQVSGEGMAAAGKGAVGYQTQHVPAEVITNTTTRGGGILGAFGKDGAFGGTLGEGALKLVGGMLQGKDASEEAAKQREWQAGENEKNRKLQDSLARLSNTSGGGASDGIAIARIQQETALKQLGEQRRQYDVARADVQQKAKRSSDALEGVKAFRKTYKRAGAQSFEGAATSDIQERSGMLAATDLAEQPQQQQEVPQEEVA